MSITIPSKKKKKVILDSLKQWITQNLTYIIIKQDNRLRETSCWRAKHTKVSEFPPRQVQEFGVLLLPFLCFVQLQHQRPPGHNSFKAKRRETLKHQISKKRITKQINDQGRKLSITRTKPDPRGRKSRATMLSKTEDFPELCSQTASRTESTDEKETDRRLDV